jgi:N-acetylmuramoyl-L-alanine amidase
MTDNNETFRPPCDCFATRYPVSRCVGRRRLPPWSRSALRLAAAAIVVGSSCSVASIIYAPRALAASNIAGMRVFLDPGHNGANDSSITRQVSNGRGGTKDCQTPGTATNDGYPEHSFNWLVALQIRDALNQMGVHTELSRDNDNALGPCVDQRAAAANAMHPDAIVSIHADGGPPAGRGFHVNYSSPPLNDAQAGPAMQLATTMQDSLVAAGVPPSTYVGSGGLYGRADLAGLNLAQYPAILVELGNMKNGDDSRLMESADGRAQYAAAVTQGIVSYLGGKARAG